MKVRKRWIVATVFVALVLWKRYPTLLLEYGRQNERSKSQLIKGMRKSQTYVVPENKWLEFPLTQSSDLLRIMSNAALTELPLLEERPTGPKPGWRYALEYDLLDYHGNTTQSGRHHLRTKISEFRDQATGETFTNSVFSRNDLIPTNSRTIQIGMAKLNSRPTRLRLRLVGSDPIIGQVVARVYERRPRPNYTEPYLWQRVSRRRRERLSRASVYTPELLSSYERKNLLRWLWTPLAPIGVEGHDYMRRLLYMRIEIVGEQTGRNPQPYGAVIEPRQRRTMPLPDIDGIVELEWESIKSSAPEHPQAEIDVNWYGSLRQQRAAYHWRSVDDINSQSIPIRGGMLQIQTSQAIVVRAYFTPDDVITLPANLTELLDEKSGRLDVTPPPNWLRTYTCEPNRPVDYSIAHCRDYSTPVQVTIRRFVPPDEIAADRPSATIRTLPVIWEFLDKSGKAIDQGSVATANTISPYDCVEANYPDARVSDPTKIYFSIPPSAYKLRLRAPDGQILVTAHNRPGHHTPTTSVPTDYDRFHRLHRAERIWHLLQPDQYLHLIQRDKTVSLMLSSRPAEDDPEIMADRYEWDDFTPDGIWLARPVLIPRPNDQLIRDQAATATYFEVAPNETYRVCMVLRPNQTEFRPTLVYFAEAELDAKAEIFLDGEPIQQTELRAARGEIRLNSLSHLGGQHTLAVRTSANARFFVNHVVIDSDTRYLRRLGLRVDQALEFTYTKNTAEREILSLLFLQKSTQHTARLHIEIARAADNTTEEKTPVARTGWTHSQRNYEITPDPSATSMILGTTDDQLDAGRFCFVTLDEDLPIGDYRIRIEARDSTQGYCVLSRTTPGISERREWIIEPRLLPEVTQSR